MNNAKSYLPLFDSTAWSPEGIDDILTTRGKLLVALDKATIIVNGKPITYTGRVGYKLVEIIEDLPGVCYEE